VVANPMVTPLHIKPVWYFTPYYAMLRAVPDKLLGVMTMGGAVMILFLLPWLDRSPVKSIRYRSMISKVMIALFVVVFITLGWMGMQAGSTTQTMVARILTFFYFAFFITMPVWTRLGTFKPVPERVTMHD
jgi:ubiquinol-cytochrome c reductase cytochrome b subunit